MADSILSRIWRLSVYNSYPGSARDRGNMRQGTGSGNRFGPGGRAAAASMADDGADGARPLLYIRSAAGRPRTPVGPTLRKATPGFIGRSLAIRCLP